MPTRLYLRSDAQATAISPAVAAGWEVTHGSFIRTTTSTTKSGSTMTTMSYNDSADTNQDIIFMQFVSDELTAGQTITGAQNVNVTIRALEADSNNQLFTTLGVRIIASDGSTVQKTIVDVRRDNVEISATALTSRINNAASEAGNYTTVAGDRIVIEIGVGGAPEIGASHDSDLRFGDSAASDLAQNDSDIDDDNPHMQFQTDTLMFGALGTVGARMQQINSGGFVGTINV